MNDGPVLRRGPSIWRNQARGTIAVIVAPVLLFYLAAMLWMLAISFTQSDVVPVFDTFSTLQYERLFGSLRWLQTLGNLGVYVAITVCASVTFGYLLAIGFKKGAGGGAVLRLIFLLPLATSFVVTGAVWQGLLDPTIGLQHAFKTLFGTGLGVGLLNRPHVVMWVAASAGVWQQTGLCAILFTIGLDRIDPAIWSALSVDRATPWQRYVVVAGPMMAPFFVTATVFVAATGLRTYDLIVVLTGGGPGFASDVPARFVVEQIMERQDLGLGAAGACVMLGLALAASSAYALAAGARR